MDEFFGDNVATSSGDGNDIRSREAVPDHIREQAPKRIRTASIGEDDGSVKEMTSFRFNDVNVAENRDRDEDIVHAFMRFLMSRNVSVDIIEDLHFRTFLTKVAAYGLPMSLIQNNLSVIQKSWWTFENEVTRYMKMVKHSWEATGCTLIFYDFDQGKANPVVGFYCPKGFIFVEVNQQMRNYHGFKKALQDHVLNLTIDHVTMVLDHFGSRELKCLYQAHEDWDRVKDQLSDDHDHAWEFCVRHRIHERFCKEICEKSKWVQSLMKKSDKIYEYIVRSDLYGKFYKTMIQDRCEHFVEGKHAISLARLRTITGLETELRCWLSCLSEYQRFELENTTDISAIINNNEFWNDGKELLEAIAPVLKIAHTMDSLTPTAGYLYMAIDRAKIVLQTYYDQSSMRYFPIWLSFNQWVADDTINQQQNAASYLIPACVLSEAKWDLKPSDNVKCDLRRVCGGDVKEEALDAEMDSYNIQSTNPFANISVFECKANHPVKLWNNYGSRFPILQKCAIKILSKPVSCMCNQVSKHLSQVLGTDNHILRLNYKMMQDFCKLGDDVYKPIDF